MPQPVERRLAAILAADVAGYSRLMEADEEGTLARLRAHRRGLIDPKIREHRGRIVKTTGDGALVEFASVVDAVRCAAEIQRGMLDREAETAEDRRIRFRIGVNLGDIIVEEGDIFGDGVNIAARLEALAEPGGICVSQVVRDQVGDRLPYAFDDLGEQSVKNIARPVRTYALGPEAIAALPAVAVAELPAPPAGRRDRRFLVAAAAAALSFVVVAGGWWAWRPGTPATGERAKPAPPLSIVVLPFENLSKDPDEEYFADGVTDDLTSDLSRIAGSFVISRTTAFTYKGKAVDVRQIGRALEVRYALEGTVRRVGDQVQLNVQLIDTGSGAHVWADRFDTGRASLPKSQDEIVARLARSLNLALIGAEARRTAQQDPEARDFIMRGWSWLYRPVSATTETEARHAFERALALDPQAVDAMIGLARVLCGSVAEGFSKSPKQDLERAGQFAREAVQRDPNSSTAHYALGFFHLFQNNRDRLHEARAEFEAAVALDSNNTDASRLLAATYNLSGEVAAAIAMNEKALRLSPRDPFCIRSTRNWVCPTCSKARLTAPSITS
jgi:adenylate cyclase